MGRTALNSHIKTPASRGGWSPPQARITINKINNMEKLSTSQMRQNGLTAFEAELVNYILTNEISEGVTFQGVPGHARYGSSKEGELVVVFNSETLSVERVGKKTITINFADYAAGRKRTPTTKATTNTPTTSTTTSNNTNNNNNMKEQNTTTTNTNSNNVNNAALNFMSQMFAQQQEEGYQRGKSEAAAEVEELKKQLDEAKNAGTGSIINVVVDGKKTTTKTESVLDPNFENILHLVAAHENIYLYGPAGSGKNTIAEQIADALGVDFYYQNTLVTKFDISGYKNAQGEYEETPFYKAWKNGGLFFADELDNSTAEAIIALNAALANGYYTFLNSGEKVAKNPNFYCIAAGNTNGQGATEEYCGRYQMDESSRDRFAFIEIDYNKKVEESICGGHLDILEFVRDLRSVTKSLQIKLICGYRAISRLAKFYDMDTNFVLDSFIFKGLSVDDIREIAAALSSENKYMKEIKKY